MAKNTCMDVAILTITSVTEVGSLLRWSGTHKNKYSPTPTSGHPSLPVALCRRPVCAATVDRHYIMYPS
ncbi:hypothetical protein DPMN_078194 [Dreissena polymorpha]|uniref:Uncharacterized protein n=1 Tax=Dreissena polymorpha TaxID=45954 RepID=A0A9D3YQR2_DREPO|nr:hypothetical protein DPMN_078194 [Dreissena polymorpha]